MCGIVGYIGNDQAVPVLLQGLEKLEYRGYDSAGVAVFSEDGLKVVKSKGRLRVLSDLLDGGKALTGTLGIGHTRWATHGAPSDVNSHPQVSEGGRFAVVHNGIIENYLYLKQHLMRRGVQFVSETDTEVVAQMLEYYDKGDILETIEKVISKVEGSYALGIINADHPDCIYAVRKDSPLIIGIGQGENFIASDIPAILSKTREICRLKDNEIAELTRDGVKFYNADGEPVEKEIEHIEWDIEAAEKGGFEHFMMKEIFEQPKAVRDTITPRIRNGHIVLDDITLTAEELRRFTKINIVACGTAYHVGVVAKYAFEELLRIPVEVDVASEFRYRDPILNENTLMIIISQSGETADTLAALREAKRAGCRVLSVVNVVGSTIATESDDVLYTWAGPEISVASTKAYSTQLAVIYLLALYIGEQLGKFTQEQLSAYIAALEKLPEQIDEMLKHKENIQFFASKYFNASDMYFIGRNVDYAASLEASLKLKEISYIHAEAYAAGEMKHGPIALLDEGFPIVAVATQSATYDKTVSNLEESKSRGAKIIAIATEGDEAIKKVADHVIYIPKVRDAFMPITASVPLQLLARAVAVARGCDVDQPRNLAKSVTVE